MLVLWRALALTTRIRPAWACAPGIAIAFAASDELRQIVIQGREPSIRDVAIDTIGIADVVSIGRFARRGQAAD